VRQECLATGFLALEGHGLQEQLLQQLFAAAEQFFDLPLNDKMQLVVQVRHRSKYGEANADMLFVTCQCCAR
jgi:isopenicillin N synthase-like dioxygenase